MAEQIDSYEFAPPRGRPRQHHRFIDGQIWRLVQGVDFTCRVFSLITQISRACAKAQPQLTFSYRVENATEGSAVVVLQARPRDTKKATTDHA